MPIISQNVEIWVEQSPSRVFDFVHCIHRCTHCLHHQSDEELLVQQVESLKRFQVLSEVLHRPHLKQWACPFWHLVNHSAVLLQQSSFPFVFVDPVFVILLVLVVTLNGHSRDSVDPRLLNLHLRPAKINVKVFAHAISISRLVWSDLSVQLTVVVQLLVMRDSHLRTPHLVHHQVLD